MIFYDKKSDIPSLVFYGVTKAASTSIEKQVFELLDQSDSQLISITKKRRPPPIQTPISNPIPKSRKYIKATCKLTAVYSEFTSNLQPVNKVYLNNDKKMSNFFREQILVGNTNIKDQHLKMCTRVIKIKEKDFHNCFKVINIRNPYERLFSTYTERKDRRKNKNPRDGKQLVPWPEGYANTFSEFIENRCRDLREGFTGHTLFDLPQYAYGWYKNKCHYDFIIRVENFEQDWDNCQNILADKFGATKSKIGIQKANVKNSPKDWKRAFRELTDKQLEQAQELCKEDAEIFDYELDLS